MNSNCWKLGKLSDIAEITMGQSPKGEDCNKEGCGIPLLNGPTEFRESHPNPTQFTTNMKKSSKKGDILFCVRGSTAGRMNWSDREYAIGRGIAAISSKNDNTEYFVRACLEFKLPEILKVATGSTFPNISKNMLNNMTILVPNLKEIKELNSLIKCIDEKININNRINDNLEKIAQTIFKQWFVDFEFPNENGEPYKSSGGEMIESELGEIPKDWEVVSLSEVVDTFNGYSYKGKELCESKDAMITIKNFDRNGGYKIDGLKEINISDKVKPHHYVEINDIIVAHTDLTQGAEIIGNPIMVFSKGNYDKLIMSMDTVKVKSKIKEISNEILYFILKDYRFKKYSLGYVNGTTVLHLSKNTIPEYRVVLPCDKEIIKQLGEILHPIMIKIANNFKENENLIKLRDTLLPKLMSGEIRVPLD